MHTPLVTSGKHTVQLWRIVIFQRKYFVVALLFTARTAAFFSRKQWQAGFGPVWSVGPCRFSPLAHLRQDHLHYNYKEEKKFSASLIYKGCAISTVVLQHTTIQCEGVDMAFSCIAGFILEIEQVSPFFVIHPLQGCIVILPSKIKLKEAFTFFFPWHRERTDLNISQFLHLDLFSFWNWGYLWFC